MFSDFTRDENHSILISSHIVSDLEKLCDYMAFLHNGKLLLCEEKDQLLAEYGLVHCTAEELQGIPSYAIKYKKENPYGVEVMVQRSTMPSGINVSPISIEELFVFMVKEAR
jgi:ABC-2 type transport system ATP-binding protein